MDLGLSILISVYNWDIESFIQELHLQATALNIPFEIKVYNDCSTKHFSSEFEKLEHVEYVILKTNLGRSKVRNKLAEDAKYSKLLFLDGDSFPKTKNFLHNYWKENLSESEIFCGGTAYRGLEKNEKPKLRWVYGKAREEGGKDKCFAANNFMVWKSQFLNIKFNEQIKGYGHEDTLFGIDWESEGYLIRNINAPLLHLGLETDIEFFNKTKEGVENLKLLYSENRVEARHNKLIKFHEKLALKPVLSGFIFILYPVIKYMVVSQHNLFFFDIIKWYWFNAKEK
ncbi:MAG: glycosyltransferase [Flavobacteriales bacterium]